MKKISLWITILFISFFAVSCSDDDDSDDGNSFTIEGKVKMIGGNGFYNVSDEIDEIRVFIETEDDLELFGKFSVSNGNLSYKPQIPSSQFLYPSSEFWTIEDMEGVELSDPSAKFAGPLYFTGYKGGKEVGVIQKMMVEIDENEWKMSSIMTSYIYVDKPLKASGSGSQIMEDEDLGEMPVVYEVNADFAEGWNAFTMKAEINMAEYDMTMNMAITSTESKNTVWLLATDEYDMKKSTINILKSK